MEKKTDKKRELLSWIATVAAAFAIFAVFLLFFHPAIVRGSSMEPNYWGGDRFFIIKDWCCGDYSYGDVVCIDIDGRILIKRVIGTEDDTVEIKNGKVYRNGSEIDESAYLEKDVTTSAPGGYLKVSVGKGELFVLGDNRDASVDSRSFGTITKAVGKTWFIYRKAWLD